MAAFIRVELHQHVQDRFSILLLAADVLRVFGVNLNISWIAAVPQEHCRPRLILNLSAQPNEGKPSVIETTVREIFPEFFQFKPTFLHILQAIWEADPVQGPVQVSNLDIRDAYHRGTLRSAQAGAFVHIISTA